ncbi:MAG: hypothetical protein R3Y57_02620 [Erysipelotrichaceae bacterium]
MSKKTVILHILRFNKILYLELANDLSLKENIDLISQHQGYLLKDHYYLIVEDETGCILDLECAVHSLKLHNQMTLYLY